MAMNPGGWYRDARQYVTEVQAEFKKITWPPQKEAVAGAISVAVIVVIVTSVLGLVDFALSRLLSLVLS